jgi:membrane fusion protein (multidrug efflux system)
VVRARFTDVNHQVSPGASVRVLLPYGAASTAIAIPASALRKGPAGDHVFVIAPDSAGKPRAHSRNVEMGALIGDTVLIVNGLKVGEQVAGSGSFKLRDGLLVVSAEPAAPR